MQSTRIPAIDDLFLNASAPAINADSEREAIAAIQDLLRGNGEENMPRPHRASHGVYGPLTSKAVLKFRKKSGLSPVDEVDHATLVALLGFSTFALPSPTYIALKLDMELTPTTRIVALLSQMNDGRFAVVNKLGKNKGIAVGILPWLQVTKDLNSLFVAYDIDDQILIRNIFGGDSNVSDVKNHTADVHGGLDEENSHPNDQSVLKMREWSPKFRSAGLMQSSQVVQIKQARVQYNKIYQMLTSGFPRLTSERGVAFGIDVILQIEAAKAKGIYDAVLTATPNADEKTLMALMSKSVAAELKAKYAGQPQIEKEASDRHRFIIGGALTASPFVPDTGSPQPKPTDKYGHYFLKGGTAKGLLDSFPGTKADVLISTPDNQTGATDEGRCGKDVMQQIADDMKLTGASPDDFIYMLNWWCDPDMPMTSTESLIQILTAQAANAVEVRAVYWEGVDVSEFIFTTGVVLGVIQLPLYLLFGAALQLIVDQKSQNREMNFSMYKQLNALAASGKNVQAVLDDRNSGEFIRNFELPIGTHHQKVLVINAGSRLIAYVGGIEFNKDRIQNESTPSGGYGSPLCDTTVRYEGPGAWAVLQTFKDRWIGYKPSAADPPMLLLKGASRAVPLPVNTPQTVRVQFTHTYGAHHPFDVRVATAAESRSKAIRHAQRYFYTEDQYFIGCDLLRDAIVGAMSENKSLCGIIVLAAEASVTDIAEIAGRRLAFLKPLREKFGERLLVFERLRLRPETQDEKDDHADDGADGDDINRGLTAYIHSKVLVVDDEVAFVGSVNSSNRSWSHDSEIDGVLVDEKGPDLTGTMPSWIQNFRSQLWNRHLGEDVCTGNTEADLNLWRNFQSTAARKVRPYNLKRDIETNVPDAVFRALYDPIAS